MDIGFALDFLRRLAANNNTAWMQENRADYRRARDTFAALVTEVLRRATPGIPELAGLTPAQVMFRLHKNDRSQTDPSPISGAWARAWCPVAGTHRGRAISWL
ncbi:DUF2461 family protein [Hymenobacter sp. BRD67]|nr:DUF2461 family protein [Hymenobacter sp. BRD67]